MDGSIHVVHAGQGQSREGPGPARGALLASAKTHSKYVVRVAWAGTAAGGAAGGASGSGTPQQRQQQEEEEQGQRRRRHHYFASASHDESVVLHRLELPDDGDSDVPTTSGRSGRTGAAITTVKTVCAVIGRRTSGRAGLWCMK